MGNERCTRRHAALRVTQAEVVFAQHACVPNQPPVLTPPPRTTCRARMQDPNFWTKFYGYGAAVYVVALGIPVFAVW